MAQRKLRKDTAVMGGADMILALDDGRYRLKGRNSHACFLCYGNSNESVMEFGTRELLPLIKDTPIVFGMNANDPTINLYDYIGEIQRYGFAGINNYPTVGLLDGNFRAALEEEGTTYDNEVEAIRIAHFKGLFTVAFVFNEEQAVKMTKAGADIVCVHLGLTKGGFMGAKRALPLARAKILCDTIFEACDTVRPDVIKMIYSGPASTPLDMDYIYNNTKCMGYIGGSAFDRIPIEQAVLDATRSFKRHGGSGNPDMLIPGTNEMRIKNDYVQFVKQFISNNYSSEIRLSQIALVIHVSASYLSTKFKKEVGCSFTEYLVKFRINKAAEIISTENITMCEAARLVGYADYTQFCKIFKKYKGVTPLQYKRAGARG